MSSRARKQKAEMNGNSVGITFSPRGLAAAECTGSQSGRPLSGGFAAGSGIGLSGTIAAGKDEIRIHRSYEVGASANGYD